MRFIQKVALKHHLKTMTISFLFLFVLYTCTDIDGVRKKKEDRQKTDFMFLVLAGNRTKGNCLRKDSSTSITSCDRRSRGICNANDLILTTAEKTFNLNEGNNLVKAVPTCSFSFINSGITGEKVADYSEEDTIKANNSYSVVDSCEVTGILSSALLISEFDFLYVLSPKGRIGIAADKIYNTPDSALLQSLGNLNSVKQAKADARDCLDGGFPQSEKDLITDLRLGNRIRALTCSTKEGAANGCPNSFRF